MMWATFLFDVGAVGASNTRSEFLPRLSPPSLLCFDEADSQNRVIQPEKAFDGRGCYVGNGADHTGVLRQFLAVCGLIDWTD
jgi:hypothetical protein